MNKFIYFLFLALCFNVFPYNTQAETGLDTNAKGTDTKSCSCCADCPKLECPSCEEEEGKGSWDNQITIGFNKTQGNSDTSLFVGGIKSVYDKDKDLVRLEAEHSLGENDDETNVDYSNALAEYKHILTDLFYYGYGASARRDEIADVRYRATIDPVLGYYLLKDEIKSFNIEAGPSYLFEEVGGIEDDYLAPRLGERFEYQISDTAKFFETADVIFSTEDSDNYLINAEAGLETTIIGNFNLILSLRNVYDNVPAAGLKKNDLIVLTSLGIGF